MDKKNGKIVLSIVGIIVLVLSVLAGTLLIQQQQDVRERASGQDDATDAESTNTTIYSFTGTAACGQITYSWNALPGASGYYLDISQDGNFTQFTSSDRVPSTTTTFTFTELDDGKNYFARITPADIPNFPQYTTASPVMTPTTCPTSPASKPTVSTSCDSGQPVATIAWTGQPANFGYWVDISETSNFNVFYNKQVANDLSTSSINFRKYIGVGIDNSQEQQLSLRKNQKYYTRVFNGFQSETTEFTTCDTVSANNDNVSANNDNASQPPINQNTAQTTPFPVPVTGTFWPTIFGMGLVTIVIILSLSMVL